MHRAYILLGSNIDKERNLPAAIQHLKEHCRVLAVSSIYETTPIGRADQPNFFNAVVIVETSLPAEALKWQVLRRVEDQLGRVRTDDPNAPRTIDLDLVLYNDAVFDLDDSPIPDPAILEFPHVALPLAEVAPAYVHPLTRQTLAEIGEHFTDAAGIVRRTDLDLEAQDCSDHGQSTDTKSAKTSGVSDKPAS